MPWRIDFPHASRFFWAEVCVRTIVITLFIATENMNPFIRIIQPEEQWMYSFPQTAAFISTPALYVIAIASFILVVLGVFAIKRNYFEAWEGLLVPSLALPMTGLVTNIIKLTVGRPRPDYFDRCYPGVKGFNSALPCTGDFDDIMEGRKSFPSGHASISFSAFGFVAIYLAGQLGVFNGRGRGQGWRFIVSFLPFMLAILMAISRTMDYHHHWQDVTVGAIIGSLVTYSVYRQYFPCLSSSSSDLSYASLGQNYPLDDYQEIKNGFDIHSSRRGERNRNLI